MLLEGVLALALVLGAHPDSESSSSLRIDANSVTWEHRAQVLSLSEALEGVDADYDGELSSFELEASRATIDEYFRAHWRLWVEGERLQLSTVELVPGPDPGWFRVTRRASTDHALDRLTVEVDPFTEKDPWHRSFVEVHFPEEVVPIAFGAGVTRREVAPLTVRKRVTAAEFLERGLWRAIREPLAMAGLALLLVAGRRRRVLAWFAAGASVSLVAGFLGVIVPQPFGALTLAGGLALLALEHLVTGDPPARPWLAGLFALLGVSALFASLAPYPVAEDVRASAELGTTAAWLPVTVLGGVALFAIRRLPRGGKVLAVASLVAAVSVVLAL